MYSIVYKIAFSYRVKRVKTALGYCRLRYKSNFKLLQKNKQLVYNMIFILNDISNMNANCRI